MAKLDSHRRLIGAIEPIGRGHETALVSARRYTGRPRSRQALAPSLGVSRAEYAHALGPLPPADFYARGVPPSLYNYGAPADVPYLTVDRGAVASLS